MSELDYGTESAVRCGDTISDLFPVITVVCQGCVLAPTLFSACTDWILGRMLERSSCGASFRNVKISDLDYADDEVIFAEILDILLGGLEVLNEELEPLGLWVSWVKTKIQAFNDVLDAAILSVPVCGEDVEVTEGFTYLGSDIYVSAGCETSGSGLGSHGFTGSWGVALSVPVKEDESPTLQVLGASGLAVQMRDLESDKGPDMET